MGAERQTKMSYWELYRKAAPVLGRHGGIGEGVTQPGPFEEPQASSACTQQPTLADSCLMERITHPENLNQAHERVLANKGAPGVDGRTVRELSEWIKEHQKELVASLLDGSYRPQAVRGVQIPKPGGGVRQLGIPTVVDRLVQQAVLQVLSPVLDPGFSAFSYGFRPGRGAHDALRKAQEYVAEGRSIVVDIDLEKFFDRVNHDVLMNRLGRHVRDKRLLKIIGRFLRAGLMQDGVRVNRTEGTPQGGPLSPLLANLMLDDLDKELEKRGHRFCRYADDCNIYVQTLAAGERVMASVTEFLERKLHLRVNRQKSAVAAVGERKFLGCRLLPGGRLGIAPQSLDRARERVRQFTRRNRGVRFTDVIGEINSYARGWLAYFRITECRSHLQQMDEWIRRKLRCLRLKQCKRRKAIADWLRKLGVPEGRAWLLALSGKGWWRKSGSPQAAEGMSLAWFAAQGLVSLTGMYDTLNVEGNRRIR
jgi:RNA-directed DNA polymerase